MGQEPIVYNPETPIAHYEKSRAIYDKVKKAFIFGTIMPIAALACGVACVVYKPLGMALLALFGAPFTLLSILGCQTRRAKMCLISVPLSVILSLVMLSSESAIAPVGVIAYILAAVAEYRAMGAALKFHELKELPGFPFFDVSMENISFAAMDKHGAAEFIDESVLHEEIEVKKYVPPEPPSDEMDEIITEGTALTEDTPKLTEYERETAEAVSNVPEELRDEVLASLGHLAPNLAEYEEAAEEEREQNADRPYERMIKAQVKNESKLSDVELFG